MVMPRESVWDYPRPAVCEPTPHPLRVEWGDHVLAETHRGYRVLETSHPPAYYFPPEDVALQYLRKSSRRTLCEWKGQANYYDLVIGNERVPNVAWSYSQPTPAFLPIQGHLCFYASRVSACYVADEKVQAQEGDFYGGWITSNLEGPLKGGPGTLGW